MRVETLLLCQGLREDHEGRFSLDYVGIDRIATTAFPVTATFWVFAIIRRESGDPNGIQLSVQAINDRGEPEMEEPFPFKEFDRGRMWVRMECRLTVKEPRRFNIQVRKVVGQESSETLSWVPLEIVHHGQPASPP